MRYARGGLVPAPTCHIFFTPFTTCYNARETRLGGLTLIECQHSNNPEIIALVVPRLRETVRPFHKEQEMKISSVLYRISVCVAVTCAIAASAFAAGRGNGKHFEFTTKSKEAKEAVAQIVYKVETFQGGPDVNAIARKAVEADPNFAFGYYLLGTTAATPQEAKPSIDKAIELAKSASEGERRYIEAVMIARSPKFADSLPIFLELAKQYPEERMVQMLLGQVYTGMGKLDEAGAAFERAAQLDGRTPRVYTFMGNIALLKGDYGKARELYKASLAKKAPNTAPFGPNYGMAYLYVYEGNIKDAIKTLEAYGDEYVKTGQEKVFPSVFIWNSIARLHLEYGDANEAIKYYEKGYATVPNSTIDETQKKIWLGRLHHGKGRALAKLGKTDGAWQEAELIKKMIEEGGEEGKAFWPSYHYIAGYLKLEAGDSSQAIDHLKQTDLTDPFHKLLLARAYDKAGNAAEAQKLYKEITEYSQVTLERAISYNEAKKKAKA
jgi:tetratricopeptide (TPR) repeat protein